jgi:hypothetical protein
MARKIIRMMKKTMARTPQETATWPTPFATPWAVIGAETVAGSTGVTAPPYGTAGAGGSVEVGRPVGGGGSAGFVVTGEVCSSRARQRLDRSLKMPRMTNGAAIVAPRTAADLRPLLLEPAGVTAVATGGP